MKDGPSLPPDPPADLLAALADLFEAYSDARTDYGPAPTRPDIATPEAAAVRAFEMIRERFTEGLAQQAAGQHAPSDARPGISSDALPWSIARAVLPPGWSLRLLTAQQPGGLVAVEAIEVAPLDDNGTPLHASERSFSIGLREPALIPGDALDEHPAWLDHELARRRRAT